MSAFTLQQMVVSHTHTYPDGPPCDEMCDLPGGIAITNPTAVAEAAFSAFTKVPSSNKALSMPAEAQVKADQIANIQQTPSLSRRSMDRVSTRPPSPSKNLDLSYGAFRDALSLRYTVPSSCACGKQFSVDHALSSLSPGIIK